MQHARLDSWAPGRTRDWDRVWQSVRRAVEERGLGDEWMAGEVFIPRTFRREEASASAAEWDAFRAKLGQGHGVVLGEIRSIERSAYGFSVSLRHLSGQSAAVEDSSTNF